MSRERITNVELTAPPVCNRASKYGELPRACHCHEWPSFIHKAKALGRFGNVQGAKIRPITLVQDEDGHDIEVSQEKARLGKRKKQCFPRLSHRRTEAQRTDKVFVFDC